MTADAVLGRFSNEREAFLGFGERLSSDGFLGLILACCS
jgi:hypothetical protein